MLEKVRKAEVPPPSTYNRRIPEALEQIVLKALAQDVDERYQYANELGDDLQRFLITSDTIFSRKDLMQYMKSTFAEDVEREKLRLQEYSDIKAPEGMLAAIEMGFGGTPSMPMQPPVAVQIQPAVEAPNSGGVRRSPTIAAMPRLTAAAPTPAVAEEESGATQVVSSPDFEEPNTQPGLVGPGRTVTPVEVQRPPVVDEQPAPRPPPPRLSPAAPTPGRPPVLAPVGAESTTVGRTGGRNTLDGIPRLVRSEPPVLEAGPTAPMPGRASPHVSPPPRPPPPPPPAPPPSDETVDEPSSPSLSLELPRKSRSRGGGQGGMANRMPLFLGGGALLLVLLIVVVALVLRPPPTGYIMVSLANGPADLKGVRVNFNGKDLEGIQNPMVQQVKAGPAVLLVSAEGYKPFTQSLDIPAGNQPFPVEVQLQPLDGRAAKQVQLVVLTKPADARLKVDGKEEQVPFVGNLKAGTDVTLEASAPDYKTQTRHVTLTEARTDVKLELEPDTYQVEVESIPSGATILAGDKPMGKTPALLRLPSSMRQVNLKLRCYDDVSITLKPAAGVAATVNEKLIKQRGCK